jgi:hypothetical protein
MFRKSTFHHLIKTGLEVSGDSTVVISVNKITDPRENIIETRDNLIKSREAVVQALNESVKQFKRESYERINNNEKILNKIRGFLLDVKKESADKSSERIDELEYANNEIKIRLETYNLEGRCKWISFKNEYKHDLSCIEKSLKDFSVDEGEYYNPLR